MTDDPNRWEFCPHCLDGFPSYLGLNGKYQEFECTLDDCGAFFRVEKGKGAYDLRKGKKLDEKSIYFEDCDFCNRRKAVKVKDCRFVCVKCFDKKW